MATDFLQGRGFQGRTLTIGSVFPRERVAVRMYSPDMTGGIHTFTLEGAPKGEYRIIHITDCWELNLSDRGTVGSPQHDQKLVPVESIASCLLKEWAHNISGTRLGRRPGIIVIAGTEPTSEEVAQMTAMQAAYFDGLIEEACAHSAAHNWKLITELHRDAGKWRGVDSSEDRYRWVTNLGEGNEKKECFWCASKILARAKFCMHCQRPQPGFEEASTAALPEVHGPMEARRGPGRPPQRPDMVTA